MHLKASYHTLGCKLNFAETATIEGLLSNKGINKIKDGETPDFCIVNTCSVTQIADKKARHLIRNLASKFPKAAIIVTGCYAQLKPDEVAALPGVELVLGSDEKLKIPKYIDSLLESKQKMIFASSTLHLKEFSPSCAKGDRTRYFLKVQDGCDYFCSYCTIPNARGRSRSGKISDLVGMARDVASEGGKEIVLTGVNIGTFGCDTGEDFFSLLKSFDEVEGIERYRISSIEPNLLTDEMILWIANEARAFMPHFHIPLQSGSDKVLKLMRRRYDTTLFAKRIETIRELIPDAYIGVDVIAGARGETESEWLKSLDYLKSLDVTKYHVFPYSERPGTSALSLGESVNIEERRKRVAVISGISEEKNKRFILQQRGIIKKVLWEQAVGMDFMHGLTENYIRVEAPLDRSIFNKISSVTIEAVKSGCSDTAIASHKKDNVILP